MRASTTLLFDMIKSGMKTDALTTALVFGYEAGLVQQNVFYANVRGEALREGYVAHMQTEAADAIMQLRILLAIHGLDFEKTVAMGETKLYERMKDFVEGAKPRPDGTEWIEADRVSLAKRIAAVLAPPMTYRRDGD